MAWIETRMKHPIILALMFTHLAGFSTAQTPPTADLAVEYSPLYILKGYTIWMNGARGTVAVNANKWFGIVGDLSVDRGHVPEAFTGETYLVGPRFSYRKLPQTVPFFQALVGGSHFSESTSGITGGGNQFAFLLGGGSDVVLNSSRNLALRLEGDYVGIRSSGSTTPAMRLGVGIVYRFGGK